MSHPKWIYTNSYTHYILFVGFLHTHTHTLVWDSVCVLWKIAENNRIITQWREKTNICFCIIFCFPGGKLNVLSVLWHLFVSHQVWCCHGFPRMSAHKLHFWVYIFFKNINCITKVIPLLASGTQQATPNK